MSLLMSHLINCTIEFSLGFDSRLEDFTIYDKDGNEIKSSFEIVENYLLKLFDEHQIPISSFRTKGIVQIGEYHQNTFVEIDFWYDHEDDSFNTYQFDIEGWYPLVNNYKD